MPSKLALLDGADGVRDVRPLGFRLGDDVGQISLWV